MVSKTSIKTALVLVVTTMFLMAFAYQASAYSAGGSTPFTYEGKVIELDNTHSMITVQAGPNDKLSFMLDKDASVILCDMTKPFTDIKIGDLVKVSYFEEVSGGYIASEIKSIGRC